MNNHRVITRNLLYKNVIYNENNNIGIFCRDLGDSIIKSPSESSNIDPLYLTENLEPTYPSIHHIGHNSWKDCKITGSLPPEYIKSYDILHISSWEFGVIGYYLETGRCPYIGYPENIENSFLVNNFPDDSPPEIQDLLLNCVNKNPKERLEINEVVNKITEIYNILSTWQNPE